MSYILTWRQEYLETRLSDQKQRSFFIAINDVITQYFTLILNHCLKVYKRLRLAPQQTDSEITSSELSQHGRITSSNDLPCKIFFSDCDYLNGKNLYISIATVINDFNASIDSALHLFANEFLKLHELYFVLTERTSNINVALCYNITNRTPGSCSLDYYNNVFMFCYIGASLQEHTQFTAKKRLSILTFTFSQQQSSLTGIPKITRLLCENALQKLIKSTKSNFVHCLTYDQLFDCKFKLADDESNLLLCRQYSESVINKILTWCQNVQATLIITGHLADSLLNVIVSDYSILDYSINKSTNIQTLLNDYVINSEHIDTKNFRPINLIDFSPIQTYVEFKRVNDQPNEHVTSINNFCQLLLILCKYRTKVDIVIIPFNINFAPENVLFTPVVLKNGSIIDDAIDMHYSLADLEILNQTYQKQYKPAFLNVKPDSTTDIRLNKVLRIVNNILNSSNCQDSFNTILIKSCTIQLLHNIYVELQNSWKVYWLDPEYFFNEFMGETERYLECCLCFLSSHNSAILIVENYEFFFLNDQCDFDNNNLEKYFLSLLFQLKSKLIKQKSTKIIVILALPDDLSITPFTDSPSSEVFTYLL